jgi:hypothetical protein
MRKADLMLIVLIVTLIIPMPVFPQQGGRMGRIDKTAREFFKSRYTDPVVEILEGTHGKVFPSLFFYSVFEKEQLVEDPLIPSLWVQTSKGAFYSGHDLSDALTDEGIVPRNAGEALAIARELILLQCRGAYPVDGAQSFPGEIPARYNDSAFFPAVTQIHRGYSVNIHFYYPDSRYAEFYSPYRNNLVEYSVTNDGAEYHIRDEYVFAEEERAEESCLNEAVLIHIGQKNLVDDLEPFLQKRALYGITDPPDRSQVQRRIKELSDLWEGAFEKNHEELASLLGKVLAGNPEFRFDSMYLYKKSKDMSNVRDIEQYEWRLEVILQEMLEKSLTQLSF